MLIESSQGASRYQLERNTRVVAVERAVGASRFDSQPTPAPPGFPATIPLPPGLAPIFIEHRDGYRDRRGKRRVLSRTWVLRQQVSNGRQVGTWLRRLFVSLGWPGRLATDDGTETGRFDRADVEVEFHLRPNGPGRHMLALQVRQEVMG